MSIETAHHAAADETIFSLAGPFGRSCRAGASRTSDSSSFKGTAHAGANRTTAPPPPTDLRRALEAAFVGVSAMSAM